MHVFSDKNVNVELRTLLLSLNSWVKASNICVFSLVYDKCNTNMDSEFGIGW